MPTLTAPKMFAITGVQVFPVREPTGMVVAFARVLLGDQLQLTSIRLYDGPNGLFVSYPNDPNHKGEDYRQLFYPITRELRTAIEEAVIAEYRIAMEYTAPTPTEEGEHDHADGYDELHDSD